MRKNCEVFVKFFSWCLENKAVSLHPSSRTQNIINKNTIYFVETKNKHNFVSLNYNLLLP